LLKFANLISKLFLVGLLSHVSLFITILFKFKVILLLKGEVAMKTKRFLFTTLIFVLCIVPVIIAQPGASEQQAKQILDATNIKGGLIVHVGCGDGKLTAALLAAPSSPLCPAEPFSMLTLPSGE